MSRASAAVRGILRAALPPRRATSVSLGSARDCSSALSCNAPVWRPDHSFPLGCRFAAHPHTKGSRGELVLAGSTGCCSKVRQCAGPWLVALDSRVFVEGKGGALTFLAAPVASTRSSSM